MKSFKEFLGEAKIPIFKGDEVDHIYRGKRLATGTPTSMYYIHNKEKSPNMGSRYGQDIEPHGQYITPVDNNSGFEYAHKVIKDVETGEVHFKNPLVISQDENNPTVGWKKRLHSHYGKKGKALSKHLAKHGYDGIITTDKYGPSETVNLKSFHE